MEPYSEVHEQEMISFYNSLSEKDNRRYAAVKARKPGRGGITYICSLFLCDDKTINKGIKELQDKEALRGLADTLGLEIRLTHYPPYTSKWNPVEHKRFSHVSRALSGVVLKSYEIVRQLIETTHTQTDLKVSANILNGLYENGKKANADIYDKGTIFFDKLLGQLNYRIKPATS